MKTNVKPRINKPNGRAKNTFALPPRQRIILTTKDMNVTNRSIAQAMNIEEPRLNLYTFQASRDRTKAA